MFWFRSYRIPSEMMEGIRQYIDNGVRPGAFLEAVITNDLRRAVEMADDENMHNLPAFVAYFYQHAPSACWGTRERFEHWTPAVAREVAAARAALVGPRKQ